MAEDIIRGTVEDITYHNSENGYCVFQVASHGEEITAVGIAPNIGVGEQIALHGEYTVHPTYGQQFKFSACERSLPTSAAAVMRYLSSGAVKGIGPVTAQLIVEKFGEDSLDILANNPERLVEIRGISPRRAQKIGDDYMKQYGVREVMLSLENLKITASEALRIYNKLGNSSLDIIRQNPYALCSEGIGIGFERADEICRSLDDSVPVEYRISAGIEYVLRHNLGNGHTCLPENRLCETAAAMLRIDPEYVAKQCNDMVQSERLKRYEIADNQFIFLPYMYRSERYCANRIALMMKVPPAEIPVHKSRLEQFENDNRILYDERQRTAIGCALSKGIMVLTGGPGTGKTTTLNAIITLMEESGAKIALAAPTGRAAKRMSELCGRDAKTIHRLLEVEWGEDDRPSFKRNDTNPLDFSAVIVDELSMMDIQLFDALLRALSVNCRLIMVGDVDQLPSVGAGNVLHDLIDSGAIPVIKLERVFRQAQQSMIVTNAHRIIAGEMPQKSEANGDFFVMQRKSAAEAAKLVQELYCTRLSAAYDFSPLTDIQVLCPSRKRQSGTINLNNILQDAINPPSKEKSEFTRKGFTMRVGDKVMQIRNNYDIIWHKDSGEEGSGVFNGDIGILERIDRSSGTIVVKYEDKKAYYSGEETDDIELAYAVTVHKSQGSEFDCVILPICDIPPQLSYRNLLYTAVTRAKKLLVIIGSSEDISRMIANNKRTRRYTGFQSFLEQAVNADAGFIKGFGDE